jgi:pyruvate-ferredoxin/flavodoxin oxidoreductase
MGKNVAITAFELAGLHVKANPKYGSEKKGQPTTFYATLSREPNRLNAELRYVNVVLSPDANVFRHSSPIAGLADGGAFVMQSDLPADHVWATIPAWARQHIRDRKIRVYALDGFRIANEEASDPELRYRMQGAAFMGAFFRASPLGEQQGLSEAADLRGHPAQLQKKFGKLGDRVVEDNLRVIRRGYDELIELDTSVEVEDGRHGGSGYPAHPGRWTCRGRRRRQPRPLLRAGLRAGRHGPGPHCRPVRGDQRDAGRVEHRARHDEHPLRGARLHRGEVHRLRAVLDAVPGLRDTGTGQLGGGPARRRSVLRRRGAVTRRPAALRREAAREGGAQGHRRRAVPRLRRGAVSAAYEPGRASSAGTPERRAHSTRVRGVQPILAQFPLAKTAPFFDVPESKQKGTGGLLSVTINPEACKGCNICVDVCPDGALVTIKQDDESSRSCARTGSSGRSCRTPTTATSTSRTSTRASACCHRCCSRRRTTCPWSAATARAWAAARRRRCTWSPRRSRRSCSRASPG